ncbi:MAG: terminase small subunit [Fluviibacter sp.]
MPPKPSLPTLTDLEKALKSAPWITAADAASVRVAKMLAATLDAASDLKDIVMISKQLNDVLGSLGMNPAGRAGKPETPKSMEVNPLDVLRKTSARPSNAKVAQPTARKSAKPRPKLR